MNLRALTIMSRQHGLITRAQAIESGMSAHHVDGLVRNRTWTAVRRGVYAETRHLDSLQTLRDRRVVMDRAAGLRIARPHALSHESSGYLLDLGILHPRPPITHITRPGVVGSHIRHGVKHHLAPYADDQVVECEGVRCLDPARTALDITREHGFAPGLVAADSARRVGVPLARLRRAASGMTRWPYATVVADVVESSSGDSDSPGETLGRIFVTELGYGVPEPQFGLTADGRTAWCDLRLGRHVFEFDGKLKYQRVDEGGLARRSPGDVVWTEKQRQDWICGFKLGMSRLVWDDFFGSARAVALERCRREYLDTCARFGTSVDDLAPYRPRGPRPRPKVPVRWTPPTAA